MLLVIAWHFFITAMTPPPGTVLAFCWQALSLSWSGLDLFFVLSGFLIAGILLDERAASNYFRVFYLRRACRLLPLYYLFLAIFLLLSRTALAQMPPFKAAFAEPLPVWSYITFTQNIAMGLREDYGAGMMAITWSLGVEEQFYLLIPLLIYYLPERALLPIFAAVMPLGPLLRYISPGFHAHVYTPYWSDALLAGVCLAILIRRPNFSDALQRYRRSVLLTLVILVAGVAVMSFRPNIIGALTQTWLAVSFAVFILIAFLEFSPRLNAILQSGVLLLFGRVSYGIYLFHATVNRILHVIFLKDRPDTSLSANLAVTFLALGLTLLLAVISYRIFEGPVLRWGHRFHYERPRAQKAKFSPMRI